MNKMLRKNSENCLKLQNYKPLRSNENLNKILFLFPILIFFLKGSIVLDLQYHRWEIRFLPDILR